MLEYFLDMQVTMIGLLKILKKIPLLCLFL